MASCAVCGKELKEGVRFCIFCGSEVKAASAPPRPAAACRVCGGELPMGTKFCLKCGTPVAAEPAPPPAPTPMSLPDLAPPPAAAAPSYSPPSYSPPPPIQPPAPIQPPPGAGLTPAKRSALPLILGIVTLIALGAGGWFGYQKWSEGRGKPRQAEGGTAQESPAPVAQVQLPPPVSTPVSTPVEPEAAPVRAPETAPPPLRTQPVRPAPSPASVPARTQPQSQPQPQPQTETPAVQTPVAPPAEPAPARTPVFQPERSYPPAQPEQPAAPRYSGPASGIIVWSGQLEGGAAVTIDGNQVTSGTINGALPGVPVIVEITPADVAVSEAPGPGNGWKRISVRSRKSRHTVVTIRWRVL